MQVKCLASCARLSLHQLYRTISVPDNLSRVQEVQQFIGYRTRLWARTAYVLLVCVTGGAAWLIAYTFPRSILWTLGESNLADADHVLAKVLP